MPMSEQITQIKLTLGSVSDAVQNIIRSLGTLATKESVAALATRDEVKNLQQQINSLRSDVVSQAADTKKRYDGLAVSIDNLPTRKELYDVESHLEKQIDGLAISTKNEFDRVYVKLDNLQKYTVEFREEFDYKANGLQNQLDNIYRSYPNRQEYEFLNKRMKKVEKVAFA